MDIEWTRFGDLAPSSGLLLLFILVVWALIALVMYWAFISGSTSMGEGVKFKYVKDDEPVSH
ncbi:hypothetical protein J2Z79_001758 [Symbiobacterium terraclitae]|uniref:Uncharacterized protein n=1 Tax=Symbiobacterium terraclitae TaxID=557451 RepID=A0ABS4JS51_9FIRM|nr:hypothetical protein [Symbiobacterium terraclitae]MBP2018350.1 hypothetical protein [Symbiobacterium terraclitae]